LPASLRNKSCKRLRSRPKQSNTLSINPCLLLLTFHGEHSSTQTEQAFNLTLTMIFYKSTWPYPLSETVAWRGGSSGAQFPGRWVTMGLPNLCGGAEKSQQCYKHFFQYSTFAPERPHDRIWGRQTFLPWPR